ncbi:MAG: elongation factor P [Parcubacteria group bacterium]
MLSYTDLKSGIIFIYQNQPFVVLSSQSLRMQQRRPVMQTKIKSLITGKIIENNFQQSDTFKEADIQKKKVKFLYSNRNEYWFSEENDPSKRFQLTEDILGDATRFLKQNTIVEAMLWDDKVINVELPVKMEFVIKEAPPSVKGNTAQGGVKQVIIETGATITVPLFINTDDIIRINTQTGEYVERAEKG